MTKEEKKKAKEEAKAKKKQEKLAAKQAKLAAKEAKKKGQAPQAEAVKAQPVAEKAAPAKEKREEKPAPQAGAAEGKAKTAPRNYHVARRPDGKWQVKFAKGEKAIKLFSTQEEAIAYAKKLAANQDGSITIHKKDGSIRKQKY